MAECVQSYYCHWCLCQFLWGQGGTSTNLCFAANVMSSRVFLWSMSHFYFLPVCIHGKSLAQYLHVYCVPWTASSIIVRPLNKLNLISSATYLRVAFRRRVQASWISSKLHQHRKLDLPNSQIKSLRRHCGEPDSYSHKSSHKANLNWSYY